MTARSAARSSRTLSILFALALAVGLLASSPATTARAAANGTITGTVTNPDGAVFAGVQVVAQATAGPTTGTTRQATTDASGVYTITGLEDTGTHIVHFALPEGNTSNWVVDNPGDPITLTAGATVTRDAQFVTGGTITGRVVGAGNTPLANVAVQAQVEGQFHGRDYAQYAFTGADGTFTLPRLVSATYFIRFTPPEDSNYVRQLWEHTRDHTQATLLPITAGTSTALSHDVQLDQAGRIHGRVMYNNGVPYSGVTVWVWDLPTQSVATEALVQTDANGYFTTSKIAPGSTYIIHFSVDGDQTFNAPDQWWQGINTDNPYGATQVTVTALQTLELGTATLNVGGPVNFATAPNPTITGASTAAVNATLTANPGTWSPAATFTYQWLRSGKVIAGATGKSYKVQVADVNNTLQVRVVGSASGRVATTRTSAATRKVPALTLGAATPTIAGTAKVGAVLTAKPGSWTAGSAFTYQWYRNSPRQAISGATKATYKPTAADLNRQLTVVVTGSKSGYSTRSVESGKSKKVATGTLTTATPKITGVIAKGATLTAKPGAWTAGTKFSYQWYRNGSAISKATKSTYKLTSSDKGKKIKVKVTGKLAGYANASKTSSQTAKVATVGTPKITGTAQVGKTLSISKGTWTSKTTFKFQWYRNGVAISKATKSTYKLVAADRGKKIAVKVTGRKSGYATVTKTTAAKTVS